MSIISRYSNFAIKYYTRPYRFVSVSLFTGIVFGGVIGAGSQQYRIDPSLLEIQYMHEIKREFLKDGLFIGAVLPVYPLFFPFHLKSMKSKFRAIDERYNKKLG